MKSISAFVFVLFYATKSVESVCGPSEHAVPLYQFWGPGIKDHMYTTGRNELGTGWTYQQVSGRVYNAQVEGTVPLYQYWNGQITDHYWTTDYNQFGSGKNGWVFQKIACYIFPKDKPQPPGTLVWHQYWNAGITDHYYEANTLIGGGKAGWTDQGIAGYICPEVPPPATVAEPEPQVLPPIYITDPQVLPPIYITDPPVYVDQYGNPIDPSLISVGI